MDAGHAPGGGPCKPPGACIHNQSYPSQLVLAKQMKTLNPKLKLLLYEATGFGAQGFGQTEMQAHPEWCLTDDDGKPFERMINGQPHGCQFVDWRKPEVRDWWIHTVNQTGCIADHIAQAGRFARRASSEFQHDAGRDITGTGGGRLIVDEELFTLDPRHSRNTLRANDVGDQWLHCS